ncbi:hypothetical protein CAI21_14190 [Alkalilimnicola ehrlichii]|uniref:Helix-hairpin-helix DNA-binding motif class 1 domain-containing protein n=1 Tax=Alkalilimnicola ehrlichii TaxID=351052 RepID=A0A3E0WN66_9GAMM|nr:helix-hairpin-helix domain-containing protein [Alkalilimnicola ehrlichii]RFA27764.1 hypothetical protein CAI21_14190 [Alkalilimnicola ehrlichii]RFA33591.1 hypothetical protein CAL65_17230 [Alkalilimnicola ehrlichii]
MKFTRLLLLAFALFFTTAVAVADVVNLNSADAEALAAVLQGVGEQRAEAIVAYRNEHGPFRTVEELLEVKGIGSATLDANRDRITLE